jgi:hypothetical protein
LYGWRGRLWGLLFPQAGNVLEYSFRGLVPEQQTLGGIKRQSARLDWVGHAGKIDCTTRAGEGATHSDFVRMRSCNERGLPAVEYMMKTERE